MADSTDTRMLATVRQSRGLTQSALAADSGLSQATVSKAEAGMVDLTAEQWARVAFALDAPAELLAKPVSFVGAPATVFHRKRASVPVSTTSRLRARLDLVHLQVAGIVQEDLPVRIERSPLADGGYTSPEEVAQGVRGALGVPRGPIHDLIRLLEGAGVLVLRADLGSAKVDALMSWPPEGRPVVLLSDQAPGDRQRFSVAHELGHAVMHEVPTPSQESEADRFAAEFLMPRADIEGQLRDVSMPALVRLKQTWRTSMSSLLRRAHDLGCISDYQYRQASIELSQAGYRTREPISISAELPHLMDELLAARLASGTTVAKLAADTWMTEHDLRTTYLTEEQ